MSFDERQVVEGWWRTFASRGVLPAELDLVQGRLVRAVHRGPLGEGGAFVKTMTFPRAKDRLRYLVRSLPAAHEATMLRVAADAGIPCPEVVAAFHARRLGTPHRSMLVLRALPVVEEVATAEQRVQEEVALACALLDRGVYHGDLHTDNFVRLASGALAVLDMQSARRFSPRAPVAGRLRRSAAVRILRGRSGVEEQAAIEALQRHGALSSKGEVAEALAARDEEETRYFRTRVMRCLRTSTEFERRIKWSGVCFRQRAGITNGRWVRGGKLLRDAWVGQRVRQVDGVSPLVFAGYFQKWWWLGGGGALYAPGRLDDEQVDVEVRVASAFARRLTSKGATPLPEANSG